MVKVLVLFYSTYGHVWKLAESIATGVRSVAGVEVVVKRVPETLPREVLEKMHAIEAQKQFEHIPVADPKELSDYDGVIFGSPTRFGSMASQLKAFLDATGGLWMTGGLVGKVGSAFTSCASQHGGQETTLFNIYTVLLHHGMVIVGLPYSFAGQCQVDSVSGCSPYGASTVAGSRGELKPTETDIAGAEFQGKHVAEIALKLAVKA